MKIATYNTNFLFDEGIHNHSGKDWNYTDELIAARIEYFAKLVPELDADVVLLEEIAAQSVIERIIAGSGIDYAYYLATPDASGVGNAVLYKDRGASTDSIPAISSLPVFVAGDVDTIGPRIWSRRDFVHLTTAYNGQPLHLLGIHIKSNFLMAEKTASGEDQPMESQAALADGLIRSELFRFAQAKKVREVIDGIFASEPEAYIVVGGDFNAEETNSVYRMIRGLNKKAPTTLAATNQDISPDQRFSLLGSDRNWLVDHLLVSQNLAGSVVNAEILTDKISDVKNVAPDPTLIASDHAPVVIELG